MTSNESKNEMLVMILTDLAGICRKLGENFVVPEKLRAEACKFREQFDSLSTNRGKGTTAQHFESELLIVKIARFLPRVLEVQALPRSNAPGEVIKPLLGQLASGRRLGNRL